VEAYCVKCKAKVEVKDPQEVTMKNGRPAISGICSVCGTKVFKIKSKTDK
jgi:RNase P subunit RPR2